MIASSVQRNDLFSGLAARRPGNANPCLWMVRRAAEGSPHERHLVDERQTAGKLEVQSYVSSKLYELRTLAPNWDGFGNGPLSQPVAHQAYRTLDRLANARTVFPFITPGEDGSVLFEWRAGVERIELEFFPDEAPYIRHVDATGRLRVDGTLQRHDVDYENVRRALSELSSRIWAANPRWKTLFS